MDISSKHSIRSIIILMTCLFASGFFQSKYIPFHLFYIAIFWFNPKRKEGSKYLIYRCTKYIFIYCYMVLNISLRISKNKERKTHCCLYKKDLDGSTVGLVQWPTSPWVDTTTELGPAYWIQTIGQLVKYFLPFIAYTTVEAITAHLYQLMNY